jgi:hypothetical protein
MNVAQWKEELVRRDPGVTFRETGAHGWDRLAFDDHGPKLVHEGGPHWIDAVPSRGTIDARLGRLLGTYDVATGTGVFF